jgi:hypothetical protein
MGITLKIDNVDDLLIDILGVILGVMLGVVLGVILILGVIDGDGSGGHKSPVKEYDPVLFENSIDTAQNDPDSPYSAVMFCEL